MVLSLQILRQIFSFFLKKQTLDNRQAVRKIIVKDIDRHFMNGPQLAIWAAELITILEGSNSIADEGNRKVGLPQAQISSATILDGPNNASLENLGDGLNSEFSGLSITNKAPTILTSTEEFPYEERQIIEDTLKVSFDVLRNAAFSPPKVASIEVGSPLTFNQGSSTPKPHYQTRCWS